MVAQQCQMSRWLEALPVDRSNPAYQPAGLLHCSNIKLHLDLLWYFHQGIRDRDLHAASSVHQRLILMRVWCCY